MSTSKLYRFQEWLEARISEVLPEGVPIFCRRKGNIDSDVENALATLGIAVVVKPPLPLEWSDSYLLSCGKVESEIHILENVLLQETQETAYSLLEKIAAALYQARCDELAASILKLESVRDDSPSDETVIHFVLPITNSLNF